MMIRTYSELITLPTFEERFNYLKLNGSVGEETFGFDRIVNQRFYHSKEWKQFRNKIIVRDNACDLAMEDYDIYSRVIIHHMNPIRLQDILDLNEYVMNPEYVVCVSHKTHNAIHYGEESLEKDYIPRSANDMCPWKK